MEGISTIHLASVQAMVAELGTQLGIDPLPEVVPSTETGVTMAVITRGAGALIVLNERHPFLASLGLRSAVAHELFHVLQVRAFFPTLFSVSDPLNLGSQIQSIVTDLFVTEAMCAQGFAAEALEITRHRLESLERFGQTVAQYGYLPVICRLPVVREEVGRFFPGERGHLANIETAIQTACAPNCWVAQERISRVTGALNTKVVEPAVVLDAYRRIFLTLSPNGQCSVIEPSAFVIREVGEVVNV